MKILVPLFLWKYQKDLDSFSSDYKQRQEDAAMKKMIDSGMTESKSIKMLEEIMKKYEKYEKEKYIAEFNPNKGLEKVKDTGDPNKELEKVKEAAIKFKEGKLNELTFRDKADICLSNKIVKHAALGLSIMNLMNLFYGICILGKDFYIMMNLKTIY